MKVLSLLTYQSFFLIKLLFGVSFLVLVLLDAYFLDEVPPIILYGFCVITGILIGYSIAYYSIRYLYKHPYKRTLDNNDKTDITK